MAPEMWLFFGITGLLTPALSGLQPPVSPGQHNNSSTKNEPLGPGELLGVRLVNRSSLCSGAVEVWLRESWEPACAALWDTLATEAVCRALGCGGVGTAARPVLPSPELQAGPTAGNASRAVNASWTRAPAVLCKGTDWRLCEVVELGCGSHPTPARVTCAEHRALRLAAGGSPCAGRVEMLEYGKWGTVCDDAWDLEDASVVCQQLRCGWAVQALPGLHFVPGQGPIHRDQVNCSGAEAYLWDCPGLPGDQYCGHKEDAGVVCSEHQYWRLTGGLDACEGQVEVHFRGVWSTVCDSTWYQPEANVLCQSLGCGSVVDRPRGLPHSLDGRMYYSCEGKESSLRDCSWRFNNSNLCSQSLAARVLCSGSRRLHNLPTLEVPGRVQSSTVGSSVTVDTKDKELRELTLLVPSIVLGILLLASLVFIAVLLWRVKGRYAPPDRVAQQHLPTAIPVGTNSSHAVPITMPKEEVLTLPIQAWPPAPKDSDSSSDSDYEHYDFSSQPPVALTTFYNSHRHRVTEEEIQQGRFRVPPLEEGLEELHMSHIPAADPRPCLADAPCPYQARSSHGSSTSSGEDDCKSPNSKLPPWNSQVFSSERSPLLEQPPNLELAGSQATFSGASADDSSSTSSGEWYQNLQLPPQPSTVEHFECPGPPDSQLDSTSEEDYDDIGTA